MLDNSDLYKRHTDPQFEFIQKQLEQIMERMSESHIENREWKNHHIDIEHVKTSNWQVSHNELHIEIAKDLTHTKTVFGIIAGLSAMVWSGLLAWIGLKSR